MCQKNISFDKVRTYFEKTDFFITDNSGIGFEYSLISGRPTVFLGDKIKIPLEDIRNNNLRKYSECPEIKYRNRIGPVISSPEILDKSLNIFLKDYNKYSTAIEECRQDFTYNLGNASPVAADEILNICKE